MSKSAQERLDWLEKYQPRNVDAINALRRQLGLPLLTAQPPKSQKLNLKSQISKENKYLRSLRRFLPGREPDRFLS